MALAAGQRLTAALLNNMFGVVASDTQNTSGTTTSTTYTATLTGGTACGLTFVAPTSGKVIVHNSANIKNSTTNFSGCVPIIREGGSIGSGTTFLAADDNLAIAVRGSDEVQMGRAILVTGLTAGNTYNVQQAFKVNAASTLTILRKHLLVVPVIA